MRLKRILFFIALLTMSGASMVQAQTRDAETNFFQQSFGDLSDELRVAVEEGKKGVFVMFDDKDCPWCAKMKATILNQPQVQDYYRKHFRIMRIDTNGDTLIVDFEGNELSEKVFAEKSRVRATPVMIFVDTQGKLMYRYTGAARNIEEFMWLGEFIVNGHYKTTNFAVYKREKKKAGM